jgi:exonuclease VII small subunit
MADNTNQGVNLTESLQQLETIVRWFEKQEEVDVEQGLTKVKDAAKLIKESKARLAAIENEFEAIEKEINDGEDVEKMEARQVSTPANTQIIEDIDDKPIDLSEIPF